MVYSIFKLMDISVDMEKESDKLTSRLQELRSKLESMQNQQTEDSRGISKQQKNTERYIAKKQMLLNRKDDCNRNIRDLGVLPEEAFEKYINEKLDRVCLKFFLHLQELELTHVVACQKTSYCQRRAEEVCACQ